MCGVGGAERGQASPAGCWSSRTATIAWNHRTSSTSGGTPCWRRSGWIVRLENWAAST